MLKAMKTINDYKEPVEELLISSLPEPQQKFELTFNPSISANEAKNKSLHQKLTALHASGTTVITKETKFRDYHT
ncbi:hypothetical protein TRFO_09427 [Tritrichomonas foetus]|uniref:Uncharacterized protein n=1 Tax=Tritrichomonas foetus TaxID=1144522 RepID=A0A1J4JFI8_9EUKA|nr:hypothetical protein TRFO_09427 [Tritrichomonas foetus]|eukprot:OHS97433.1 hypothetical protein TRFO_09427 [Tritrichomonas foetus]